jgi:ectoine hydroxylase-related dioxygenase (phytanoyl-CoA dioxygenase family)
LSQQETVLEFINQTAIDSFHEQGATVVRGLFTVEEIATIERGIEKNLADPSPMFKVASRPDDPGRFVEDFCNWNRIDEYRSIAFESKAADVARQLMGGSSVRLFHDHMLVKEPGTKAETPWHQDQPYYNVDGDLNCSMWAPVDPVALESTLEFNAGSHKRGWLMPRTFMDNQAKWFHEGSMSEIPQIEADRDAFEILGWELQPGDAVFFHMLTTHHSYGVQGVTRRRAFSLRFLGDDMVHAPRNWVTSPNFDGLNLEIPAGAPMEHELFPVLRKASSIRDKK